MHDDVRAAGDEKPCVFSTMRPNCGARCGGTFDENPRAFLRILLPCAHTPISECLTLGGLSGWRRNLLMKGKRGLIMGLANDKSIAWGIAKECADAGAELAFSYQGEALKKRVSPLANSVGSDLILECDVSDIESLDELFFEN